MIINKLKNWLVVTLSVCVFALIGVAFANVTPAPTATADTTETRTAVATWDISKTAGTDNVMAYLYQNATDNTKYDLVISGTGAMADYGAETVPWFTVGDEAVDVRKQIISVEMQEGLTNIGKNAFNQLTALTSVEIPATVTEIRNNAFYGCGLTEVTIPATVKKILGEAFNASKLILEKITFLGKDTVINAKTSIYSGTTIYGYTGSTAETYAKNNSRNFVALDVISLFKKVNVSLGADLTVNYQVALSAEQAATAKMDFTINTYSVSDDSATLVGEGLYEFSFTGVAPQWIGDSITAVLTAGETEETKNYSVLQYCNAILGSDAATLNISDAKFNALKTLVADLVAYGAAAQTYTGDTDEQVSVDATGSTFTTLTETDEEKTGSLDGVTFVGANLVFNKANALKFYFTAENANLNVLLTKNGVPVMVKKLSDLEKSGEQYIVTTEDIYATELDDIYTLTVYGEDMTQGASITYSVQSYVYANQANEANANLAALVKALWVYGESAKAYNKAA